MLVLKIFKWRRRKKYSANFIKVHITYTYICSHFVTACMPISYFMPNASKTSKAMLHLFINTFYSNANKPPPTPIIESVIIPTNTPDQANGSIPLAALFFLPVGLEVNPLAALRPVAVGL